MKRILVVDDEPDHRLILTTVLEGAGHGCIEAQDGTTALEILSRVDVDVILTDLNMPGMNGVELSEHIRKQARLRAVPIILLTSQDPEFVTSFRSRENLFAILPKPYEWDGLFAAIDQATNKCSPVMSLAGL